MKQELELNEIETFYPQSFHPLATISDHSAWVKKGLFSVRCSVFSRFLTSVEELEMHVDNITEEQKIIYRQRFYNLIDNILSGTTIYKKQNAHKHLHLIELLSMEDVIELTEEANCNLFVPEFKLVFLGHDDFGFIILSDQTEMVNKVEELINKNSLFLVFPPLNDESSRASIHSKI